MDGFAMESRNLISLSSPSFSISARRRPPPIISVSDGCYH